MATVGIFILAGLLSIYPYGGIRQTIFLTLPVVLLASLGVCYLEKKTAYLLIYLIFGVFFFYGTSDSIKEVQKESLENIKPIAKLFEEQVRPEDKIFVSVCTVPAFNYYLSSYTNQLAYKFDYYKKFDKEGNRIFIDYENYGKLLSKIPDRIWILFSHYQQEQIDATIGTLRQNREVKLVSLPEFSPRLYFVAENN